MPERGAETGRKMIDMQRVYLMTKAAIFEDKEKNGALKIVSYRRQDYILYHMLFIMLSVTGAYAILVGAALFMIVMAYESLILNTAQMVLILIAVVLGYIVVLTAYYMISHKYYGEKHVKARQDVRKYLSILQQIRALDEEKERQNGSV